MGGRLRRSTEVLGRYSPRRWLSEQPSLNQRAGTRLSVAAPPLPVKWSDLGYVFDTQEDPDGEERYKPAAGGCFGQSKISRVEINSRIDTELVEIGFKPLVGPGTPHVVDVLQEIPIGVQSA